MKRREFLRASCAVAGLTAFQAGGVRPSHDDRVMTVTGLVSSDALGQTLTHEHVLVDFAGAGKTRPEDYDLDEAFAVVLPYLRRIRELGCRSFIDCTPAYIGRSPGLLVRLAQAADIRILTNTGYYGAANDKFLPAHAFTESASALADRWTAEWEMGIEGSGVRPGFIKIGVDAGSLSEVDKKLVRAAARTHLRTGLTILSHTGPAMPAFEQLAILMEEGVDPGAWVWTHAQNEPDEGALLRAAKQGAWVALDGISPVNTQVYVSRLDTFKRQGLLDHVLLSHDAGWYSPAERGGGSFRAYDTLFTTLLPALRAAGFTPPNVRQLTETNPAAAFRIRMRSLTSSRPIPG